MRSKLVTIAAVLVLSSFCIAQDASANDDSNQSIAAAASASRAQVSAKSAKEADIRRLLDLTGAGGLGMQSIDQSEKTMRPLLVGALPAGDYRDKLVDLFFEKFHAKISSGQLVDLVVPIYDKYYSDDEIKQLIAIYSSPIGKKLALLTPKVLAEAHAAGEQWGQELGKECMMEVLAEHPEMRAAIEQAKATGKPQ